jgi:predicted transcriptional regulator
VIDVSNLTITQALVALAVERENGIRACELKKKIPLSSAPVEKNLSHLIKTGMLVKVIADVPKYYPQGVSPLPQRVSPPS